MKNYICILLMLMIILIIYKYYYLNEKNITDNNIICNEHFDNNDLEQTETMIDTIFNNYKKNIVYLDIQINDIYIGKITILLYDDIVPLTVENFTNLIKYNYKYNHIFKIKKNKYIQTGDYITNDGTNNMDFNGELFKNENFIKKHNKKYLLSMISDDKYNNGSQFMITLDILPELDNKQTCFGEIINESSYTILNILNNIDVDENDKPLKECIIIDCNIID